jgi:hypothetical protein
MRDEEDNRRKPKYKTYQSVGLNRLHYLGLLVALVVAQLFITLGGKAFNLPDIILNFSAPALTIVLFYFQIKRAQNIGITIPAVIYLGASLLSVFLNKEFWNSDIVTSVLIATGFAFHITLLVAAPNSARNNINKFLIGLGVLLVLGCGLSLGINTIQHKVKHELRGAIIQQIQTAKTRALLENKTLEGKKADFESIKKYMFVKGKTNPSEEDFKKVLSVAGIQIIDYGIFSMDNTPSNLPHTKEVWNNSKTVFEPSYRPANQIPSHENIGTLTNRALQKDIFSFIAENQNCTINEVHVTSVFVNRQPTGEKGISSWAEVWSVEVPSGPKTIHISFKEDGKGGTDFNIPKKELIP